MENIENIASSLDAQALGALRPFQFSDSPLVWSVESDALLSEMYWVMVQRTKDDIRAVAQNFRRARRAESLLLHMEDINGRTMVLRTMLMTVDLIRWHESGVSSRIDPQEQRRLQDEIPTLRNVLRSVVNKSSAWQAELGAYLNVFALLEGPVDAMELLLSSLSPSLPNVYLAHGKIIVERLARLWSQRRAIVSQAVGLASGSPGFQHVVGLLNDQSEDQRSIIRSLSVLVNQINEVPPLYFLDQEFTARQLSSANWVFSRLELGRASIVEDIERLENSLDHFLDVLGADEDADED